MRLAVVVPCYNERRHVGECLRSLAAQVPRPGSADPLPAFDVLCADNNSTDGTAAAIEDFGRTRPPFRLHVLRARRQGPAWARAAGIEAAIALAAGEGCAAQETVIAWIDADTTADPHWIAEIARVFRDPAVSAAAGDKSYAVDLFLRVAEAAPHAYLAGVVANEMIGNLLALLRPIRTPRLNGANSALRASAYLAAGGMVQLYHDAARGELAPGEEYDLARRLHRRGYATRYLPTDNLTSPRRVVDAWIREGARGGPPRTYPSVFTPADEDATLRDIPALRALDRRRWRRIFLDRVRPCIRSLLVRDVVNAMRRDEEAAARVLEAVLAAGAAPVLERVRIGLGDEGRRPDADAESGHVTTPYAERLLGAVAAEIEDRVWTWLWRGVLCG